MSDQEARELLDLLRRYFDSYGESREMSVEELEADLRESLPWRHRATP